MSAAAALAPPSQDALSIRIGRCLALMVAFFVPWGDAVPFGELSLSRWLTIPLGIAWVLVAWRTPTRKAHMSHVLLLLFIAWASIGVIVSLDLDRSWRRILSYYQLFIQAWVLYQFTRERRDWHRILQALLFGAWICVLGVFDSWRQGNVLGDGRYSASGFDPNDLAATIALGIPIAWYQFSQMKSWRWLNGLYMPCAAAAVLLTASRGGLVVLAMAGLFPLWTMRAISWSRRLALVCVVGIAVATIVNFRDEISFHRLATLWPQLVGRDLNGRWEAWVRGWEVLQDNPSIGVGPGAFATAIASSGGTKVAAHNTFLEIAVEHGVIGLALFGGALFALWRQIRRVASLEKGLLATLLAMWAIASSALSWENREITWLVWALCACCQPTWFAVVRRQVPLVIRRVTVDEMNRPGIRRTG